MIKEKGAAGCVLNIKCVISFAADLPMAGQGREIKHDEMIVVNALLSLAELDPIQPDAHILQRI